MAATSADAEYDLEGDWGGDDDFAYDDEFVAGDEELKVEQAKLAEESPFVDPEDDSITFGVETMEKQERLCILPWLAVAKHRPADWVKPADLEDEPKPGLEIEWVWGYRCRQARRNIHPLASGEIVWPAAGLAVVYNAESHAQRHYVGHEDDVCCIDVHPDGKICATGGMQRKRKKKTPAIHVWDSTANPPKLVAKLQGTPQMGVKRRVETLCFSPDGKFIACAGGGDEHRLVIWDWEAKSMVTCIKTGSADIYQIAWSPDGKTIVCGGDKHVTHFAVNPATGVVIDDRQHKKRGLFSQGSRGRSTVCGVAFGWGASWTVGQGADLLKWKGNGLCKAGNGSTAPKSVGNKTSFSVATNAAFLAAGDDSGKIRWFDCSGGRPEEVACVEVPNKGKIISLAFVDAVGDGNRGTKGDGDAVYAGTSNGCIFVVHKDGKHTLLQETHHDGETWGLSVSRSEPLLVSSGDDNKVMLWDLERKTLKNKRLIGEATVGKRRRTKRSGGASTTTTRYAESQQSRCAAFDGLGDSIAIGKNDGSILWLDRHLKEVAHIKNDDRTKWIQDIKFDPTGEYVAVGTHDRMIDIYSSGDFKRTTTLKGHNSFITHLDWSECGDMIQSNDGAYEMLFWDPESGKQLLTATEQCAAEPWDSWTCVLGWPVFGIWEPGQMLCQINSVERSPAGDVLAVGDDNGRVKLFRYPCVTPGETKKGKYTPGARAKTYLGHSSHVCNVRWSFYEDTEDMSQKGTRLVSVGGNDNTIIVWKRV